MLTAETRLPCSVEPKVCLLSSHGPPPLVTFLYLGFLTGKRGTAVLSSRPV